MAVSRDVARVNFAAFIKRMLAAAHARGLTNKDIYQATGVAPSTFSRWQRGDWGSEWPKLGDVVDFCEGLGVDPDNAVAALGFVPPEPTKPLPIHPKVRPLLAMLADPNVNDQTKEFITWTLEHLASTLPPPPPTTQRPKRERRAS